MKTALKIILGLVVLLAIAGAIGFAFVDGIVERVVEEGGTRATGVETKLGGADVGILSGELALDELVIANPAGFSQDPFLRLGVARAGWENRSLTSDTIEVRELVLDGVALRLEKGGQGSNWGAILANLEKMSGDKPSEPEPEGKKKTLHVGRIEIRDVKATLTLSGVPIGAGQYEVVVPRVTLDEFRTDGSTSEVVGKLTRALLQAILEATVEGGANLLPKDILADLGGKLDDLRGELEGRAESVLEDARKKVEDAIKGAAPKDSEAQKQVDEALKGVGDLFKKKQE